MALGADAVADRSFAVAFGTTAQARGANSFAAGSNATALGDGSLAFGGNATASQNEAVAIGAGTNGTGFRSTAVGRGANAATDNSVAIGGIALAVGARSIAIGGDGADGDANGATASGTDSMALGVDAIASHSGSVALGAGAATTAVNQVRIGTASTVYSTPGLLTSSDAAQTGAEFFVTVDANGTLGKGAQSSAAISQMGAQMSALQQGQAVIDDQIAALQQGQSTLFDLRNLDRKEWRRGIAAATAMSNAPFPPEPGQTGYAANTAVYHGQVAFSASITHRFKGAKTSVITAGVSHAGGKETALKAGVAGVF